MARDIYKRSKPKGPSKLMNLLLVVLLILVGTSQWERIRDFIAQISGMYGTAPGLLDTDFRRVSAIGKTAVARYWVSKGHPPTNNLQAGLEDPVSYKSGSLLKMEVIDGGALLFQFDRNSGVENGTVTLVPDSTQLLQNVIKWTCVTSSYPNLPDCQYRPAEQ